MQIIWHVIENSAKIVLWVQVECCSSNISLAVVRGGNGRWLRSMYDRNFHLNKHPNSAHSTHTYKTKWNENAKRFVSNSTTKFVCSFSNSSFAICCLWLAVSVCCSNGYILCFLASYARIAQQLHVAQLYSNYQKLGASMGKLPLKRADPLISQVNSDMPMDAPFQWMLHWS